MRPEKKILFNEIKEKIDAANGIFITRYKHLEPNMSWGFRDQLAKNGGLLEVVKKRIFKKVAAGSAIDMDEGELGGHIALVFALEDPLDTLKAIFKFKSEHQGLLEVLGGELEGKFYSGEDVKMLSALPSLPDMRAQFLGLLEAPLAQTLSTMDALLTGVMHCIQNKTDLENK